MKNKTLAIQSLVSILAIIGITYGKNFSVPDAVSKSYGFPLTWGIHQLVTIAGPVDIWSVNIANLVIDLASWLIILEILVVIFERRTIY